MLPQYVKLFIIFFLGWQKGRKVKSLAIEHYTFTTDKSKVQRLDTDIANLTAESLNIWLINFVEELSKEDNKRYPPRLLYSAVFSAIS